MSSDCQQMFMESSLLVFFLTAYIVFTLYNESNFSSLATESFGLLKMFSKDFIAWLTSVIMNGYT